MLSPASVESFCSRRPVVAAFIFAALILIGPALLTPFNTKGEPREAIVAVSMLMSGDWVLPVSFGTDIPYKPPFMAWLIALFSLPVGHVTEFTSRLPSIIASMALAATLASFVSRDLKRSGAESFAAAAMLVTTVEVWRGGGVCRVDMILTAAIVGSIVLLYRTVTQGGRLNFFGSALLMSVGALTKGPVGIVLPALVVGAWLVADRTHQCASLLRALLSICGAALIGLVLPALWYWAAYQQGGEGFLDLVMEENFGRMTGSMSYASHENPWWYNLTTLAAGLLPYTLIPIVALFVWKGKSWPRWSAISSPDRLTIVGALVILIFYTIPASKRSVYLLPMYPFVVVWLLRCYQWCCSKLPRLDAIVGRCFRIMAVVISVMLLLAPVAAFTPLVSKLPAFSFAACWGCAIVLLIIARAFANPLASIAAIYFAVGISVLPPVAEKKSDHDLALELTAIRTPGEPVWEIISEDPLLRYYTAGFYLDDIIRPMPTDLPSESAWLLASPADAKTFTANYPDRQITLAWEKPRSCDTRRPVAIYRVSPPSQP